MMDCVSFWLCVPYTSPPCALRYLSFRIALQEMWQNHFDELITKCFYNLSTWGLKSALEYFGGVLYTISTAVKFMERHLSAKVAMVVKPSRIYRWLNSFSNADGVEKASEKRAFDKMNIHFRHRGGTSSSRFNSQSSAECKRPSALILNPAPHRHAYM